MVGLVERFHRTWKECVSLFVNESQDDWDEWVDCALYAYNSAVHSTTHFTPNELMLGRRLRPPNELLRRDQVTQAGPAQAYYDRLVESMQFAISAASRPTAKEQLQRARYYNRKVRSQREFKSGDLVWFYSPPRGPKFKHRWIGPVEVIDDAGYDNLLVRRHDQDGDSEDLIVHSSFVVSYYCPEETLTTSVNDFLIELDDNKIENNPVAANETTAVDDSHDRIRDGEVRRIDDTANRYGTDEPVVYTFAARKRRRRREPRQVTIQRQWHGTVAEVRRRRRRNKAGLYALEIEIEPCGLDVNPDQQWMERRRRWVGVNEFERLWRRRRVVEASVVGEFV
ncbi:hypothetical protein PR001_g23636 [Phytophthora rubi]|uniref:Integrase catalytic domain-containing protein n=1 Tax=Phytophthora rubi TaxID=129364 RepID=A0A6A3IRG7_9STRA|nr:hypothetical protein PR001_g23636 [Phytophthora rubi]